MRMGLQDVLVFVSLVYSVRVGVAVGSGSCSYSSVTSLLQNLTSQYPYISRLDSIGQTKNGRELWVIVITDAPQARPLLRPQVKLVGNVNGKSLSACEVLLKLASHLLQAYEEDGSLERALIETTEIHILPNVNPESKKFGSLNRDFPDIFGEDLIVPDKRPETLSVIRWIHENNFVLSASLVAGMYVICIPFDNIIPVQNVNVIPEEEHLTPDNEVFAHLGTTYWNYTNPRATDWHCPQLWTRNFAGGIVNGASWYPTSGTMMDYNYIIGVFELMIGLSCEDGDAEKIWVHHKQALLHFISQANTGVKGQVIDKLTKEPVSRPLVTKLHEKNPKPWLTSIYGEFWRPLPPGLYAINVSADGYIPTHAYFEVRDGAAQPVNLQIVLEPYWQQFLSDTSTESEFYANSASSSTTPANNLYNNTTVYTTQEIDTTVITLNETRTFHKTLHGMLVQLVSSNSQNNSFSVFFLIGTFTITFILA